MQTNTNLRGILALLVAGRDQTSGRSTDRILADAGLTAKHIAMLTGRQFRPARAACGRRLRALRPHDAPGGTS
jgi:hypothetical protein